MKRTIKKLLLLILLITLVLNLLNFNYKVEAKTNGYTPDTAIEYVKSLLGQSIDVDGVYPGECVDLIMAYELELSGTYYQMDGLEFKVLLLKKEIFLYTYKVLEMKMDMLLYMNQIM